MASLNKVFVLGRLGQDPELRYTANQAAVCTLNVATSESWTGKDGQRQEQTEWHRVVVWNRQAENCSKYLAKGRIVFVEGRLQTRSWEDKNGQKRFTTEINANNVQFIGGQPTAGAGSGKPGAAPDNAMPRNEFDSGMNSMDSFHRPEQPSFQDGSGMSLEDIPF